MSYRYDTIAIHAELDGAHESVTTPIYQTTTYAQHEIGGSPDYSYSRTGNPTRDALARNLAAVEGAKHGFALPSGIAAANLLLQSLSAGDHVVASQDLYGGCYRLFTKVFSRLGIRFSLIDTTDTTEVARAVNERTKLLWLESPSNPLLKITDIEACCAIANEHGIRVVVDNTFATPVFQRPLELGAHIVLHSTTKYFGGHCDVLGGALITNDERIAEEIRFLQNATGAVPGPQDCFLLLRGLKTLRLRVERHAASAFELARRLEGHPEVTRVVFPGLESHPQHDLAARQATGFGSILSIELDGGIDRVKAVARELRLWTLAESLGGVKSLWCHPPTMTHAAVEPEERRRVGIGDGLIRLSVGLEDPADLYEDLDAALAATCAQEVAR